MCYFILVTFPLNQIHLISVVMEFILFYLLSISLKVSLFVCCQICQSLIKTDCEQIESQFAGWLLGRSVRQNSIL